MLFASLITRTAQDIDILIDSLPSHEYTEEMQVNLLLVGHLLYDSFMIGKEFTEAGS